jgi:DNA-binding response OmpR family regulator
MGSGAGEGSGKESGMARILVIDDEPDVVLLCHVNLEHAGHQVIEAGDGRRGLDLARSELPDAIVLDLMLPALDGFGVLEELGDDATTRELPVIVLSAKTLREDRDRCLRAGAVAYLTKPFSPIELTQIVSSISALSADQIEELRTSARARTGTATGQVLNS